MWKSLFCIALVLLLALIGLGLNTLLVAKGKNDLNIKADPVYFRWEEVKITVKYPLTGNNSTQTIKYSKAYTTYCKGDNDENENVDDGFCNSLKKVRDGGRAYMAFGVIACCGLALAGVLCILVSLGRCLCNCKCRFAYVIGGVVSFSNICLLISIIMISMRYYGNLNNITNELLVLYFGVVAQMDWNTTQFGVSLYLLIFSFCFGILSLGVICHVDKKEDKYECYHPERGYIIVTHDSNNNYNQSLNNNSEIQYVEQI